jgi:hypothetical protein
MLGDIETNEASAAGEAQRHDESPKGPARRPYQSPRLRHLGSVRKLTLAGTGTFPDFNNNRHQRT